MQRTETGSHQRNDVPVKRGKARDTLKDSGLLDTGDSSCGKGETQKSLAVHSQLEDMGSRYKTLDNQHKTEKV